ncbi:hypothetical protein [Spirochaeta isovalerica]|uniref:Uncharacterized protein n=1 Tax=Spirochaeta isovalerica TaxID=150 RepID=A0A841RC92_9SPIO|nr:hypothetical protein [Spirochaeta isovalerica]MBB6481563.1 hypothetical protein [Spirochaeta isovalerica]
MDRFLKISIYVNAGIWFLFALLAISGLNYGIPSDFSSRIIIALLAAGAGGAMILGLYLAEHYSVRWYYLLLLELMLIVFLTLTDEFGWPDAVVLITHIFSLAAVARKVRPQA